MADAAGRIWRLVATGFAFVAFGVGGIVTGAVVFPLVSLVVRRPDARLHCTRAIIRWQFLIFVRTLLLARVFTLEIGNLEELSAAQGVLIVANHPTLIDVVILVALAPRAQCIVKEQLWRNPFLKHVVTAAGYIPNDLEPGELLERCRKSLAGGCNIVIFPEGTRTPPDAPLRFSRGFANVAYTANAPILPVVITCEPVFLTRERPWYRVPERPPAYHFFVGEYLECSSFVRYSSRPKGTRQIVNNVENYFRKALSNGRVGK